MMTIKDSVFMKKVVPYDELFWSGKKVPNFRSSFRAYDFFIKNRMYIIKHDVYCRLPPKIEKLLLNNINLLIEYAKNVGRLPNIYEQKILESSDPKKCLIYFENCLLFREKRFEEIIIKDAMCTCKYLAVIKDNNIFISDEDKEKLFNVLLGDSKACYYYFEKTGTLPKNLHNFMMIIEISNSDSYTSNYFKKTKEKKIDLIAKLENYLMSNEFDKKLSIKEFLYELKK